jgi:hypothetical protein
MTMSDKAGKLSGPGGNRTLNLRIRSPYTPRFLRIFSAIPVHSVPSTEGVSSIPSLSAHTVARVRMRFWMQSSVVA